MQARWKRKWLKTMIVADKTDTLFSVSEALLTSTVTLASVGVNVWGRCTDHVVSDGDGLVGNLAGTRCHQTLLFIVTDAPAL
jgi:hypothetical protein